MFRRFFALMAVTAFTTACDVRPFGGLVGVTPPATRIAFVSQPNDEAAGAAITPAVQLVFQNTDGQTIPSANAEVTLSIAPGTGTAGAVLTGGGPLAATSGVVNFTNLRINLAGTGYRLLATVDGFPSVTSDQFNITP